MQRCHPISWRDWLREELMARVTGLGGVFFKTQDANALRQWYQRNLGLSPDEHGAINFPWRDAENPESLGQTVFMPFPSDTKYFEPSRSSFMFNFRVDNLDELLLQLRQAGVSIVGEVQEFDYGRFAWIMDPEGQRIELWEPPHGS